MFLWVFNSKQYGNVGVPRWALFGIDLGQLLGVMKMVISSLHCNV